MLNDAFDRDWSCMAFGEDHGLALGPSFGHHFRWRWQPLDQVNGVFQSCRAPLIIAKPIVESQRALELLEYFSGAKVIWAYRHYLDVAKSSIELFGSESSLFNLNAVIDPAQRAHWFSQNLAESTRAVVRKHFAPDRPLQDLKCLGWFVRNSLFFQFALESNDRVTLSRYESLVGDPVNEMQRLYRFLQVAFPGSQVCDHIHKSSVRKGSDTRVSDDISDLCQNLLDRLDDEYRSQALP
jgi:hypothetical protein